MADDELQGGLFTVIEGKDGWLFLEESGTVEIMRLYTDPDYMPTEVVTAWAEALRSRREYFESLGITYVTLVVPDSCLVYSEKLPDDIKLSGSSPFSLIAEQLDAETLAQSVYPLEPLVVGRSERETFRPTDSHWTDWGAYLGYRATMEHLAKRRDDIEMIDSKRLNYSTTPTFGALGVMLDEERPEMLTIAAIGGSEVQVVRSVMNEVRDGFLVVEQDRPDLPSAVVFRDSFMTNAAAYFSESFRRVNYCTHPNSVLRDLIEDEKPDVVIYEMSEGRLYMHPRDADLPEFRTMFGDLLMADPDAVEAEVASRTLLASGDAAAALRANDDAMTGGVNARILLHRSRCYVELGNLPAAVETLRAAVLVDPEDGVVWHELAIRLRSSGLTKLALQAAREATRVDPGQPSHWVTEVGLTTETDDPHLAVARGREALALHPADGSLQYGYVIALLGAGDFDEAVGLARRSHTSDPESIPHLSLLASALIQSKRWSEADRVLRDLEDRNPGEPSNQVWLEFVGRALRTQA